MTHLLITRTGVEVALVIGNPGRDGDGLLYHVPVSIDGSPSVRARVRLAIPDLIVATLRIEEGARWEEWKPRLVAIAIARTVESGQFDPQRVIEVSPDNVTDLVSGIRWSDRDIRRYVVRRAYAAYSRTTLDSITIFGPTDFAFMYSEQHDVKRAAQVLEEEGYLSIAQVNEPTAVAIIPKARLVRDVERYGSNREDAITEHDYAAALGAYPSLDPHRAALLAERRRYDTATTAGELASIFRSTAPIVEQVVKDLLHAAGSQQQHATLGPAIQEMQQRRIGSVGILSQLNHVLKFVRDLAQHGTEVPEPVLRIATQNLFELAPQLAALFPRVSDQGHG